MTNEIKIIYEDDDVLVVNKPAGLLVHPDGHKPADTVVDWFLTRCPQAREVGESQLSSTGEKLERSGVVHRLDRDTSGVLILAKHQAAFEALKRQFHDRLARKEYRAFVYGLMSEVWGSINRPIGRHARDFRLRSAERGSRGQRRQAVTDWECLASGQYEGEAFSYLKLKPKTGRLHQIRVHLKAISRPVVGDTLYAPKQVAISNNLGLNRLALHAFRLRLVLPVGREECFEAPLPESFRTAAEYIVHIAKA